MIEEIKKVKDEPGSASEPKDIKEFVEVNGKKFVANPKTPNIPLLNENGDPVPFIPKGKDGGDIDYKTKLEQAESTISKRDESLRKAGYTIQNLEKGQKESLSQEEIKEMIDAKVGDVYAKISTQSAKDLAYKMSGSVDEAKLVLFHYKNSVVKTGKLDLDMSNAYAIANKDKGAKTMEEIQRSLDAKKLLGKETGVGGKRTVTDKARPILNPTEENLVSSTGLTWDTKEGAWKGKSGKLYKHLAQGEGSSAVEGPGQGK